MILTVIKNITIKKGDQYVKKRKKYYYWVW